MDSFLLAFGAVFPMFCYMALGKLIAKLKWLEYDDFRKINYVLFELFIPCMLFSSIYNSDFRAQANLPLIAGVLAVILALFVILWRVVPHFVAEQRNQSVVIQGIYRSNYVLFGMLLAQNIYPDADMGAVAALAAFLVPLYNILAIILFESFRGKKVTIKVILQKIAKNTLVWAGVFGTFFALTGLRLPVMLTDVVADVGNVALLMALICLGGMLSFNSVMHDLPLLKIVLAARLLLVPLLGVVLFASFGYRNLELVMVLAAFGSPNAVASAPMAYAMGGNGDLAGEIVAVSSAFAILSIFLFVWVLRAVGLLI